MKKGVIVMKKTFILALLFMVFSGMRPGLSFETWEGYVTTNIKLRKNPGLNQKVLAFLNRGDRVTIVDKNGDWYQIVRKGAPLELKGWVFEKYIKPAPEKAEVTLVSTTEKEEETNTKATELPSGAEKETAQISQAIGEENKGEPLVVVVEEKKLEAPTQPQEAITGPEKSSPPAEKPVRVEQKATPVPQDKGAAAGNARIVTFFRDLLKGITVLVTVILSCLAFIFSFRAYRIAQECYQTMIRFQVRWQSLQEKERGER